MDHSNSAGDSVRGGGTNGAEGRGTRASGAGPAAGSSSYLDQDRNPVTNNKKEKKKEQEEKKQSKSIRQVVGSKVEVRSCGCRSRFCPHCCLPLGIQLKGKLRAELVKFKHPMMLTFTIDPQLFSSPAEAYRYVTAKRCIAVTIQRLHRWKLLHSDRYFAVIEWQQNGWPHWHVLVDADRIPFDKLCEAWNRNWRGWRQRVALGRPGFGSVRFSVDHFDDRERAAGYVTAYLTKHPDHGYPDWVLDSPTRSVHRFQTSRGFWTDAAGSEEDDQRGDDCNESVTADGDCTNPETVDEPETKERRTVREQIASCGNRCVVLLVRETLDQQTGETAELREFVLSLPVELSAVVAAVAPDEVNQRGTLAVYGDVPAALRRLRELAGDDSPP